MSGEWSVVYWSNRKSTSSFLAFFMSSLLVFISSTASFDSISNNLSKSFRRLVHFSSSGLLSLPLFLTIFLYFSWRIIKQLTAFGLVSVLILAMLQNGKTTSAVSWARNLLSLLDFSFLKCRKYWNTWQLVGS